MTPPVAQVLKQESTATASVDVADAFDALAGLDSQSIDLICTSPPYWGMRTYGHEHNDEILKEWELGGGSLSEPPSYEWYKANGGVLGLEPAPDWYVCNLVEIFAQGRHALRGEGSLWINLGDTYFARWASIRSEGRQGLGGRERLRRRAPSGGYRHDKQLLMIPARFAIAMQEAGWILRNDLIWSKPHVGPRPEKDRLRLSHEHFFHFVSRSAGKRPSYFYDLDQAEDKALDVVSVDVSRGSKGHPATYPAELIAPRIRTSCPEGGTVCDPFCGAGTTLAVALESGRNSVGFDLSDEYVDLARARLEL